MPRLVAINPHLEGLRLTFHIEGDTFITLANAVSRNVIGLSFPIERQGNPSEYCYACVVAEFSQRSHVPRGTFSRYYAIIDEADTRFIGEAGDMCLHLKDTYRASALFCPLTPAEAVRDLKTREGLTHYKPGMLAAVARQRWPSFSDFHVVARVRSVEAPAPERQRADLNALLTDNARDPDTGQPMFDGEGRLQPRLFCFGELNTKKADAALQRPAQQPEVTQALWMATMGLERSAPPAPDQGHPEALTKAVNPITGY